MAIVFADEARRRRRLRLAGRALIALALVAGGFAAGSLLAGGDEDVSGEADPVTVQTLAQNGSSWANEQAASAPVGSSDEPIERSPNAPGPIDCQVTDGDTLNCSGRRIRLIGIDAPELPGHCRDGRDCVVGDPFAASSALQRLIAEADLQIVVSGRDSYDRELANVYADGRNVACSLIAGGSAVYVEKWDEDGIVKEDCNLSGL